MVFARTKLLMHDTCFEEKPGKIDLNYAGPNAEKVYNKAYEMIKVVFRASDSDIQEENYSWTKGEKEKFKVRWWLHKDLDRFTYFWIRFDVSAEGGKQGTANITITPYMRTEYPQDTAWQRSLFYEMLRVFWHRIFYHNQRVEFIKECRDIVSFYAKQARELFRKLQEEG
jgi:hypothetical protein